VDLKSITERLTDLGAIRSSDHYRLRPDGPGEVLDVGCGRNKYPGATGIDISPDTDADLLVDLDETPYPLESDSFDQILCQDVLEHVARPLEMLDELYRIGRPGARIHLRTPHYSSVFAYGDPTHVHTYSVLTIRSFEEPLFDHYSAARFRVVDVTLDFWDPLRWIGIARLANRFQSIYEMLFAFRFPAMNIRAKLEIVK
jgi:SAM-dependent methyltransferase